MELHPKHKMIKGFTKAENGNLKLYELQTKVVHRDEKAKTLVLTIGPASNKETLTVLLFGETGSGKTHLLNAIANTVLGVNYNDYFRFVIKDQVGDHRRQVESQTDYITSYLIYHMEGMPINYNLRIIDTPGFGDTRPDYEGRVTDRLFSLLMDDFALDFLHCIGLVEKASNNRITRSRLDTLKAFSSLFSCDAGPSTKLLATFTSDGNLVEEVVRTADIPFSDVYEFDNWPLYKIPKSNKLRDKKNHEYRWDNMEKELTRFLVDLSTVPPVNIKKLRLFYRERKLLAETKNLLKKALVQKVSAMKLSNDLKMKITEERKEAESINWNPSEKHYEKEVSNIAPGYHAHNCNICDKTCLTCKNPSNINQSGMFTSARNNIGSNLINGLSTGAQIGRSWGPIGTIVGTSVGGVVGLTVGVTSVLLNMEMMPDCPKASSSEPCKECKHKMTEHTVGSSQVVVVESLVEKIDSLLKARYDEQMREIAKTEGLMIEQEEQVNESSKILENLVPKVKNHIRVLGTASDALTQEKFLEEMAREIQNPEQIEILKSHFQT